MGHRGLAALAVAAALAREGRAAQPSDAALEETLVITATRTEEPAAASPAPVTVLGRARVQEAKALDEALRQDPSFATFRRNSSLVADPTSQGVNLRGVAPSGVSRALVLEDSVPLNDGFGGWVYWSSIPRLGLERVEIAPGAWSSLYGSSALGGVVQLVSRPISDRAELELQGGSFRTVVGALSLATWTDTVGAALDAEGLTTSGYGVIAAPGPVDHRASSEHAIARLRLEAPLGDGVTASMRVAGFVENEDGGTRFTTASARQGDVSVRVSGRGLEVRAFGRLSRFQQDRARLLPDAFARISEQLAGTQSAPADEQGASVQWHDGSLTAGVDLHRVYGRSLEDLAAPSPVLSRRTGGEQQSAGIFVEELLRPAASLQVQAAARVDGWRNLGGVRRETLASGADRDTSVAGRSDAQVSPRVGLRVAPIQGVAVRAAGYRSFRAPTLNELYRPFQVGPVRTEANPDLGPETLWGGEAGVDVGGSRRSLTATAFLSRLGNPVVNATAGPNQQVRQNLGAARIWGLELRGAWTVADILRAEIAWTMVRSRVLEGPTAGRALPQDPRHRVSAALAFDDPRLFSATIGARFISDQYEDDRNTLRLPGFLVVDAAVSRRLGAVTLFAAAENLLDRTYLSGLQGGVATLGQPLSLRAGIRLRLF